MVTQTKYANNYLLMGYVAQTVNFPPKYLFLFLLDICQHYISQHFIIEFGCVLIDGIRAKWHVLVPGLGFKTLPLLLVSASQNPKQHILIMQCQASGVGLDNMMEGTQVPE